jgi:hypothetical protein
MALPDRIEIPALSLERVRALRSEFPVDLTSVGPSKPLGNYPLDTLQYSGISPCILLDTLNKKQGVTAHITSESPTHGAGITAFHREALQKLLDNDNNLAILRQAGWPHKATAFVKMVDAEWVNYERQPSLCGLIADAFSGRANSIATMLEEMETEEYSINENKIFLYIEMCAAGLPVHIAHALNAGEATLLASRMVMNDIIYCIIQNNVCVRFRGNGQGGELSLIPGDEAEGKDDVYPLLIHTLDFDCDRASALLDFANTYICNTFTLNAGFETAMTRRSGLCKDVGADSTWAAKHEPHSRKKKQDIGL